MNARISFRSRRLITVGTVVLGGLMGAAIGLVKTARRSTPESALPQTVPDPALVVPRETLAVRRTKPGDHSRPPKLLPVLRSDVAGMGKTAIREQYNSENVDPHWAPVMEAHLRDRLGNEVLRNLGLDGVSLTTVECRTQSCLMEIDFPESLYRNPPHKPNFRMPMPRYSAFGQILAFTGPFADVMDNEHAAISEAVVPTIRETVVITFQPDHRATKWFPGRAAHEIRIPKNSTKEE
jgi:hypothetical protein